MHLDLSTRLLAKRAVVSVAGEVDLDTAPEMSDHALAAVRDVSPHVVIDVSGVSFMDSTGLKVLVAVHREAEAAGGSFAVVGSSAAVLRVLSVTGLDQVFALHESMDDLPA